MSLSLSLALLLTRFDRRDALHRPAHVTTRTFMSLSLSLALLLTRFYCRDALHRPAHVTTRTFISLLLMLTFCPSLSFYCTDHYYPSKHKDGLKWNKTDASYLSPSK